MTSTLLVQATVTIPAAIIGEAALSFLGLGVQPPTPSWGVMLARRAVVPLAGAAARRLPGPRDRALLRSRSTCSATGSATSSTRGRRADAEPLLDVADLSVRFETDDGHVHAVDRISFTLAPRRGARDRRRVGLRQERDVMSHPARCCPTTRGRSAARLVFDGVDLLRTRGASCAASADARSRSSSRSR